MHGVITHEGSCGNFFAVLVLCDIDRVMRNRNVFVTSASLRQANCLQPCFSASSDLGSKPPLITDQGQLVSCCIPSRSLVKHSTPKRSLQIFAWPNTVWESPVMQYCLGLVATTIQSLDTIVPSWQTRATPFQLHLFGNPFSCKLNKRKRISFAPNRRNPKVPHWDVSLHHALRPSGKQGSLLQVHHLLSAVDATEPLRKASIAKSPGGRPRHSP